MPKTHPVLQQSAFVIKTPPLVEFVQTFSRLVEGGEVSMVFYGRQRYGKSSARRYLVDRIKANGDMVALWASVQRDVRQRLGRERLWREMLRAQDEQANLNTRNPYDTLINLIRVEAEKLDTDKVIIALDEAQNLTLEGLGDLKKLVDEVVDLKMSPFVVLSAQPEILLRPERLRKFHKQDLIDRFFTQMHEFRGILPAEVPPILTYYDTEVWEGQTYSEHFAPQLWKQGWRLEHHAGEIVDAFSALNRKLSTESEAIGMKYLSKAIRLFLVALKRGATTADEQRKALSAAVNDCGMREAWTIVGDSLRSAEQHAKDGKKVRIKEEQA